MSKPAFLIEEGIDSLTVTLKPRKQWFAIVLTVLIFFAFLFTFIPDLMSSFVRERQASSSIGVTVAILVYTFLSIALLTWSIDLIWQFKGWEVVEITRESFNLHHQIGNLRISRKFSLKNLERIKVLDMKSRRSKPPLFSNTDFLFLHFSYGRLEIHYNLHSSGERAVLRFGSVLKDTEAKKLSALIQKHCDSFVQANHSK